MWLRSVRRWHARRRLVARARRLLARGDHPVARLIVDGRWAVLDSLMEDV